MTSKSERTRQRILDAAATELATRGYGATSIKNIADAAGMQDASLYYHFSSKDELVAEVLRIGTSLAHEPVAEAIESFSDDGLGALQAAIVAHAQAVLAGGDFPRANVRAYGQLPPSLAAQHIGHQRAYGALWRDIVDRAYATGQLRSDLDPRVVRLLVLGALNWAIEWYDASNDLTPRELGEQLSEMVFGGLAT